MYPLARTTELIIEELASETIVYDTRRHRAHCLNKTAGFIWRQCDGETSLEQIAHRLSQSTGLPRDDDIVRLGLRSLNNRGLLADAPDGTPAPSRRELMGRLAVLGGAAGLLPAITSVVAPTPAMAKSGDFGEPNPKPKPKPKPKDR